MENPFNEVPLEQESFEITVISVCEICGKSLSQDEYDKHLKSHKEKRMETCEICFKTFTNLSNYKYHMAHHSNDRPWLCSECPKTYKTKIDLLQHQRIHDKARDPFKCETCGQMFRTRSTFKTHERTHLPKGPQMCTLCDKTIVNLRSHNLMVHQGVRPHICKICEKAFGKKSGLERHIVTVHEKLRLWACELCDKSFGEKAQLQRHQKVHVTEAEMTPDPALITEDKQVFYRNKIRMRCGICQRIVNSKAALKRHKLLIHEKRKEILCDFCPKLFGEGANLRKHVRKHHPKEAKLDISDQEDPEVEQEIDKSMIEQHGFTETYPCPLCKAVLLTSWGFKSHEETCLLKRQKKLNKLKREDEIKFEDFGKVEEVFLVDVEQPVEIKEEPLFNNEAEEIIEGDLNDVPLKEEYLEEAFEEDDVEEHFELVPEGIVNEAVTETELVECEFLDDIEVLSQENIEEVIEDFLVEPLEVQNTEDLTTLPFAPREQIKCLHCPQVFKKTRYLQSHMITVHNKKKFKCCIEGCGETFVYSQRLRHLRKCHPEIYEEPDEEMESQDESEFEFECNLCKALVSSREVHDCQKKESEDDFDDEEEKSQRVCLQCKPRKIFKSPLDFIKHVEKHHSFKMIDSHHDEDDGENSDRHFINKNEANPELKADRTCEICHKVFKKTKYKEVHKASVHGTETLYFCPICNRGFSFQRSMDRHIRAIHEDRKDFICSAEGCEKAFRSRYEVNEHYNNIHEVFKKVLPIEELTCNICEKVCSSRKVLYSHKKLVHEGVKWGMKFECKLCKENFESKYKKTKHWGQVHRNGKVKSRTCHVCNTDFQLFEDYKDHIMRDHEGSFICFICGRDFNDESTLFIHSESHRKVEEEFRQYICDVCSHRLSTKAQLLIHMRKHFNGDYYMCDVCGKSYKFIAPFLHHKMGHENRFDFPCRYCEKKFRVSRDRMLHERVHTKERPYKCDQCQKAFAHKANYVSHLKTHELKPYACKLCGLLVSSAGSLRQHEDQEHPEERPFKCANCRKSFKATHYLDLHKQKCLQGVDLNDEKDNSCFEITYF